MFWILYIFIIIGAVQCGVVKEKGIQCSPLQYECLDGTCISISRLCDGVADCGHEDDEGTCTLGVGGRHRRDVQRCSKVQFECRDGACVSFDRKCDGVADCPDGSDETYALCRNNRCQSNWFRCTYGACVDGNARCNNKIDCIDQSDELHPQCSNNTSNIVRGAFNCGDGNTIPAHQLCDGVRNCANANDESIAECGHTTCATYLTQCAYGACVDAGAFCDGKVDCADASDESSDICNTTSTISTTSTPVTSNNLLPVCTLPSYPEYGSYVVLPFEHDTSVTSLRPGDAVASVRLKVSCKEGFGFEGNDLFVCFYGNWVGQMPKCTRYCKLSADPSVSYKCVIPNSNGGTRECREYEPDATEVIPECTTHYYAIGALPTMKCHVGSWSQSPLCQPDCGTVTSRADALIFGGVSAQESQVPWHVGVYHKQTNKQTYELICGGTIISNGKVISAAHCFWSNTADAAYPVDHYAISAGKLYRERYDKRDIKAQHSDVAALFIPSLFHGTDTNLREDIAIVQLTTPFTYSAVVRPVCVHFGVEFEKEQLQANSLGMAAGWGYISAEGKTSAKLRVVWLPYIDADTCYRLSPDNYKSHISRDKFCAGYMNGTAALCKGDSGGGLSFVSHHLSRDRHYLRGVVSTAPQNDNICNTHALTAFTSLMHHEAFVRQHIDT